MTGEAFYPQIDITGTPMEMGLAHGQQLQARIRRTVEAMRARVGAEPYGASWDHFQTTFDYCRRHAPDLIEEMEGIGEGAEIDLRDVFLANAHLELLVWKALVWDAPRAPSAHACSSHAVATEPEVLLGWNGDDWPGWRDCGAVIRGRPAKGEPFLYWSLAGSLGRPGMNSYLALGANSLPAERWRPDGLLYPMLSRRVLACRTAEEGVEVFRTHSSCCAMNYLIADKSGSVMDVETHTDGFAVLRPEDVNADNYLLHTNCYLDHELAGEGFDAEAACPRLATARRRYRENTPVDISGVRGVLSDHTGAICVHREEISTIVSFVAEVRAGRFHVTRGNPCSGLPQTYLVNEGT